MLKSLDNLGSDTIKDWNWTSDKEKDLRDLVETDLKIIKYVKVLLKFSRDKVLSKRIIDLAKEHKKKLKFLIKLAKVSRETPIEKFEVAEKILKEIEALIRLQIEDVQLIKGMTHSQARKLGIEIVSFYTVQSEKRRKLLIDGKGKWPFNPLRTHLGKGVYAFEDLKTAKRYLKNVLERIKESGKPLRKLFILKISFSRQSINNFEGLDVDKLDETKGEWEAFNWLKKHSYLFRDENCSVIPHRKKHVIRGTGSFGKEHFFAPECLEESIIEDVEVAD